MKDTEKVSLGCDWGRFSRAQVHFKEIWNWAGEVLISFDLSETRLKDDKMENEFSVEVWNWYEKVFYSANVLK